MKMFKWLGLGLLTATSVISTSCVIANSISEHNQYINSQDNNSANTLVQNLSTKINDLKTKINEVDDKIGELKQDKVDLTNETSNINNRQIPAKQRELEDVNTLLETAKGETQELLQQKGALEAEIISLREQVGQKNRQIQDMNQRIKSLNETKARLTSELQGKEQELSTLNGQNSAYEQLIVEAWNKNIKGTVWSGETHSSLLNRFKNTTGIDVELENQNDADIEIGDRPGKFEVQKGSIKLELDMGDVYEKERDQKRGSYKLNDPRYPEYKHGTEVSQIGYFINRGGEVQIKNMRFGSKVPKQLPWFITDLSGAFQNLVSDIVIDLEHWDVSNVKYMINTFRNTNAFNHNIASWNTSKVIDFRWVFWDARGFRQSISSWRVDKKATTEFFMNDQCPLYHNPRRSLNLPTTLRERFTDGNGFG
ncbi:BspA family leucine-rich repeat surface protein [Mycoplasma cottewii]|uniref:BspA family leucine-rich repeat surface protein n=1 Tax=Mycoplasma cottewii TaxID=51364 RepID=A0ABY5TYV0_9MOLU|nr:BspA family leucine-rich repeat surface protein [Mycoplasma cottewii]UWD34781.1 BspA family leucine-rich repeat surface protein [Mycoplasma cottewii]